MTNSHRPHPFSTFTTPEMWNDPHISLHMLSNHLDPDSELASRSHQQIDDSIRWLSTVLRLKPGARLLDLGCGPGLYSHRLARQRVSVTGIDVSSRSVDYATAVATEENLPAKFIKGSYLDQALGGDYDSAILIYEDYCALSPEQRKELLKRIHSSLKPGGRLVFDVTAPPRFSQFVDGISEQDNLMNGFWSPDPYHGRLETWTYPELRLALEKYTITTANAVRQFYNWTQCLSTDQVREELSHSGLSVERIYGDVVGAPFASDSPTFAVLARV